MDFPDKDTFLSLLWHDRTDIHDGSCMGISEDEERLLDFDMTFGHRNDADGYAKALTYFDRRLPEILGRLREDDLLMITADHGCDPGTPSTDHSREYIPLVVYGKKCRRGVNLGTRSSFADIGRTILDYFGISEGIAGESFLNEIM